MAVRLGQIRRVGWVIMTLEAQVGQFLLGCKCPVSRCIVVQEQGSRKYEVLPFRNTTLIYCLF